MVAELFDEDLDDVATDLDAAICAATVPLRSQGLKASGELPDK